MHLAFYFYFLWMLVQQKGRNIWVGSLAWLGVSGGPLFFLFPPRREEGGGGYHRFSERRGEDRKERRGEGRGGYSRGGRDEGGRRGEFFFVPSLLLVEEEAEEEEGRGGEGRGGEGEGKGKGGGGGGGGQRRRRQQRKTNDSSSSSPLSLDPRLCVRCPLLLPPPVFVHAVVQCGEGRRGEGKSRREGKGGRNNNSVCMCL